MHASSASSRVHHLDNKQSTRSDARAYDSYRKQISGDCEKPSPQFRPDPSSLPLCYWRPKERERLRMPVAGMRLDENEACGRKELGDEEIIFGVCCLAVRRYLCREYVMKTGLVHVLAELKHIGEMSLGSWMIHGGGAPSFAASIQGRAGRGTTYKSKRSDGKCQEVLRSPRWGDGSNKYFILADFEQEKDFRSKNDWEVSGRVDLAYQQVKNMLYRYQLVVKRGASSLTPIMAGGSDQAIVARAPPSIVPMSKPPMGEAIEEVVDGRVVGSDGSGGGGW
ncbi:hypothetical protein EV421DRAFT_1734943 [Armillaria borealis]|uniref:Uncharacterized protein n=1 Tax=Armillaria borealis TaxID=47425 RepID=A0AA39JLZ2_9AGAR|nr:hypothetical protein EV421DRAFT_1734943 [Armillaria borealis]